MHAVETVSTLLFSMLDLPAIEFSFHNATGKKSPNTN